MGFEKLRSAANKLEQMLKDISENEHEAVRCLSYLEDIFARIRINDSIDPIPYQKIPCSYEFHNGDLSSYLKIKAAYAMFSIRLEGLNPDEISRIIDSV